MHRTVLVLGCVLTMLIVSGCVGDAPEGTLPADDPSGIERPAPGPGATRVGPVKYTWMDSFEAFPVPRWELTTATMESNFFIIGGYESNELTFVGGSARVDQYDAHNDTWVQRADYPLPIHHAAGASDGSRIFIVGGFLAGSPAPSPLGFVLDPKTDAWTQIAPLPIGRAEHVAAFLDGKIYVAGGIQYDADDGTSFHATDGYVYDIAMDAWTPMGSAIPTVRDHASGIGYQGRFWVLGGLNNLEGTTAVEAYDPATGTWEKMPPLPSGRSAMGVTVWNGGILVAGGEQTTATATGRTDFFGADGTWVEMPDMTVARFGLGMGTHMSHAYAFGGTLDGGGVGVVEALMPMDMRMGSGHDMHPTN